MNVEGQRRWTAVLLTDMAGFSAISEEIGPENVYILLGRVIEIATACVERHGGHTIDYAGDSILAAFGAPIALENASLNACRAALDFLQEIERAGPQLRKQFGVRPSFRVGIGGGQVVFGNLGLNEKLDQSIIGPPVNQAARLEALAAGGEVDTKRLARAVVGLPVMFATMAHMFDDEPSYAEMESELRRVLTRGVSRSPK